MSKKVSQFVRLSEKPILDKSLHNAAFRMYAMLAYHADQNGQVSTSIDVLASAMGLSIRQVHTCISDLRRKKYVTRLSRGNYLIAHRTDNPPIVPVEPPQPKPVAPASPPLAARQKLTIIFESGEPS
jgi:hypothetical protein